MVCRLVDFAFVAFKLLTLKVCGIIGISKVEFFNFPGTESNKIKHLITIQNVGNLTANKFSNNFQKISIFF